jgi:hypothetical protein
VRRIRVVVAAGAVALPAALLLPDTALAHGLVGRADLPIPEWLFAWAAAVVLVVSFAALGTLWREPKLQDDEGFRPLPRGLSRAIVNPVTDVAAGAIGVGVLALVVWSGISGTQEVQANFAPTFIYVIFWVGLVPASVLLGDVFRAFNPWRAIARAAGFVFSRGGPSEPLPYPPWLGRWPAAATLFGFGWMELAYTNGSQPRDLAIATLVYTGITMLGIAWYGSEAWLGRAEGFSVYFNLFSRISPVTVRDGRLGLRRPLSGLPRLDAAPGTVFLLMVMLGIVTFDGASEGPTWASIAPDIQDVFTGIGLSDRVALEGSFTVGMLMGIAVIGVIYAIGITGVHLVEHRPEATLGRTFVHSLVPIAAVYVIAHYISFLLYNGQSISPLASDPLGKGWDIFGTADKGIDYGIIGATGIWYVQVGALVTGHVCGLVLAHDRAIGIFERVKAAVRSQYWMLGVMIGYTCFGLWLLSQANG